MWGSQVISVVKVPLLSDMKESRPTPSMDRAMILSEQNFEGKCLGNAKESRKTFKGLLLSKN